MSYNYDDLRKHLAKRLVERFDIHVKSEMILNTNIGPVMEFRVSKDGEAWLEGITLPCSGFLTKDDALNSVSALHYMVRNMII